ncbi:MAG: putative rane protein [Candidatus Saccharibacteria bacterium]|nr:putative rane protein [Candidatus Saccharibacteria bacterium]
MHPINRRELWQGELALVLAIILQFTLSPKLQLGPKYGVSFLLLLLVIAVAFTAPRRHIGKAKYHVTLSTLLIGLVSIANAAELAMLTGALIHGSSSIPGKDLLRGALAVFLTNIIVFGLWYWELDSPGLSGRRKRDKDDFQFPQSGRGNWRPMFFDYIYTSMTNSTAFSPTDTMPLTHAAKLLMSLQALISLLTVVLVTARAVNILG